MLSFRVFAKLHCRRSLDFFSVLTPAACPLLVRSEARHSRPACSCGAEGSPNPFPCHTYEKSPPNSNHCHTSKTRLCNSCVCHTSETPRGVSLPLGRYLNYYSNFAAADHALLLSCALFTQRAFDNPSAIKGIRTLSENCRVLPLFPSLFSLVSAERSKGGASSTVHCPLSAPACCIIPRRRRSEIEASMSARRNGEP